MQSSKAQSFFRYSQLAKSSVGLKQSMISVFGSLVASGLAALVLMMLSRFLGPLYFGQFSTAFALTLILVRINDLGLSVATSKLVPVMDDKTQQQALLNIIFKLRLGLSGIIVVIGIIASQYLPAFLLPSNPSLVLLAFLLCFATAFFEHAQFALQALHKFKIAAFLNASQGALKLILVLPLIFLIFQNTVPLTIITLIVFVLYMLAPIIPVLLLKTIKPASLPISLNVPASVDIKQLYLKIWQVAKHAGLGIIAAGVIENIDILFVQAQLSDFEAGLLAGVSRIALLLYILAYALGNVLNPRVALYKDWLNLHQFWKKAWLILALSILGFVLSMFLAKPLILLTIGSAYLPALDVMRILLAAGFITIAAIPFIAMFYAFNLAWYFSVSGVIQLVIVLAGNYWLVPIYGIEASAWTRLVARVVLLLFTIIIARAQYSMLLKKQTLSEKTV